MLLAVNIGNTNTRFAVFPKDKEAVTWTINTKPYRTEDECYAKFSNMYQPFGIEGSDIENIVIGSVVPALTQNVSHALEKIHHITPFIVDRNTPSEVKHRSNQMGTDIYANAVAAHYLYEGNKIIIDFGTALTFMGIGKDGHTLGAIIAPGVNTSLHSLIGLTAQLPEIELKKPETVLGHDTESSMQSGLVFGFLSLVEGMVARIKQEIGDEQAVVISTGGMGGIFAPNTAVIDHDDRLHTVKGLKILFELNK